MATKLVNIAEQLADVSDMPPEEARRYVQWVLAGNISPTQASDILAMDIPSTGDANLQKLVHLIRNRNLGISAALHEGFRLTTGRKEALNPRSDDPQN